MKRITIAFCAAVFLLACNSGETKAETKTDEANVASSTSDSKAKTEWVPVDSATAMKTMMEVGTPGPQHAHACQIRWKLDCRDYYVVDTRWPPANQQGQLYQQNDYGWPLSAINF